MEPLRHHLHEPQPRTSVHEPGELIPPPDPDPVQRCGSWRRPARGPGPRAGVLAAHPPHPPPQPPPQPPPPPQLPPPPPPSAPAPAPPSNALCSRGSRRAMAISTSALHRTPAPNRAVAMASSEGEAPPAGRPVSARRRSRVRRPSLVAFGARRQRATARTTVTASSTTRNPTGRPLAV